MDSASATLRLGSVGGPWLAGALVLAFVVVAVLGVREAVRLTVPRRRYALIALRLLTAAGAALFALDLQWITERMERVDGRLAVLLDASRSMGVRDDGETRAARAATAVRGWLDHSSPGFELFRFGAEARPLRAADLPATGLVLDDDTRIERALERVSKDLGDELGAVLIVSDGADRAGPALADRATRLGVRVHTVTAARTPSRARLVASASWARARESPAAALRPRSVAGSASSRSA